MIAPCLHSSANPDTQTRHRQVSGQQVKCDEPGRGGIHETCRHTSAKIECAHQLCQLRIVARCDPLSSERTNESTDSMRQKQHHEVPRFKKVYGFAETFSAVYIYARRGRNERQAESDQRRVDDLRCHAYCNWSISQVPNPFINVSPDTIATSTATKRRRGRLASASINAALLFIYSALLWLNDLLLPALVAQPE